MSRYVVLHHELPADANRGSHWDLMLEQGQSLRTWALANEPLFAVGESALQEIEAEQLADHRVAYLTYEGPVSGDRGNVSRWDEGEYRVESETGEEMLVVLRGRKLRGLLTLRRQPGEGHSWRVSFKADPTIG